MTLRAIWTRSSAGSAQGPARCPAYRRSSNLQNDRVVSCAHSAPRSLAQRAAHRQRLYPSAGSPPDEPPAHSDPRSLAQRAAHRQAVVPERGQPSRRTGSPPDEPPGGLASSRGPHVGGSSSARKPAFGVPFTVPGTRNVRSGSNVGTLRSHVFPFPFPIPLRSRWGLILRKRRIFF